MGATGDVEEIPSLVALVGPFVVGVELEHASKATVMPFFSLRMLSS